MELKEKNNLWLFLWRFNQGDYESRPNGLCSLFWGGLLGGLLFLLSAPWTLVAWGIAKLRGKDYFKGSGYDKVHKTYTSACGKFQHDSQKKWIVDIDEEDMPFLNEIRHVIGLCDPDKETSKIVAEIPSKSGLHLITTPFNKKQFKDLLSEVLEKYQIKLSISLQTNNPTNCYIP